MSHAFYFILLFFFLLNVPTEISPYFNFKNLCVHLRGKDSPVSPTEMSATGKKIFPWGSSAMVAMVAKLNVFDKWCSLLLQSDRLFWYI